MISQNDIPESFRKIYITSDLSFHEAIAVTCYCEEEAKTLLKYLAKYNYRWGDNISVGEKTLWESTGRAIVYFIYKNKGIAYGNRSDIDTSDIECAEIFDEIYGTGDMPDRELDFSEIMEVI